MQEQPSRPTRPSAPTLSRLLPLADRVEALTRRSGRAFVSRDATAARSLIADDGELRALSSALDAAEQELFANKDGVMTDVPASAELVHALQTISRLAATICAQVVGLAASDGHVTHPAIEQLAQLVPDHLRDALGAFRKNDAVDAEAVRKSSVKVDVCFAQSYLDLMQVVRQTGGDQWETAQRLHAVTRALERIGDRASDIADNVVDHRPVVQA